ncbi:MAG: rhodanese-like domain-containing protein [Cellvibrionaceae bacterium]
MPLSVPELVQQAAGGIRRLDAQTALAEYQEKQGLIIDVREPGEVSQLPTPGTINIPRGVLEMKITELCPNEEAAIYIHCASGGRATLAAEQLKRLGYTDVTAIACTAQELCQLMD